MLYAFSNLAQRLSELNYPESLESGFQVLRRDLTQEEQAGNIEFREDGIYLTIDGQEYKGYMYLKYKVRIERYGLPKFHVTNCSKVREERASHNFHGRYFWHNSNVVSIEDRPSGRIVENQTLRLCNYCRNESNINEYSDTKGFLGLLDQQEQEDFNQEAIVDIFGYTLDWQKISREFRKEKEYTCENCRIKINKPSDRRFIHVHHKNGNKLNNRRHNLECLCVLCHANKDATHEQNFERRRMQADIRTFIEKYRRKLEKLGNEYLDT